MDRRAHVQIETLDLAMRNFKDESFIAQYLSPKLIRDFKLFSISDDSRKANLEVTAIHNEQGYKRIRHALSEQYNLSMIEPNIEVYNVDIKGDRSLTLRHTPTNDIELADTSQEVLKHLHKLWGFPVKLVQQQSEGSLIEVACCPDKKSE